MEDRKSWAIKDEAIFNDLSTLMSLNDEEKAALSSAKEAAENLAPQMVDSFYARLEAHEATAEYLNGKTEHLRAPLQNWFISLFSGNYDAQYVNSRIKIGEIHVRIGLPVRYPLAMMDVMLEYGDRVAAESPDPEKTKDAFRKLLSLDIAIFNQAYENLQLKHLAETVGNERLARRLLMQD